MKGYAARLDRIYLSKLFSHIEDTATLPVSFSDHLCVCATIRLNSQIQVARPRWRLNVSLLESSIIKKNFEIIWSHLQERKTSFSNIIQWWEIMAKPQFKLFYINQGKEQNRLKRGLLRYYEMSLRELYDRANSDSFIDHERIRDFKNKIDLYREKEVEGIRIRSRIQDMICGERISRYLISKQKEIAQRKHIIQLRNNEGTIYSNFKAIKNHVLNF